MKQVTFFALVAFFFLSSTCKKEIQLPDPELKTIFGKWQWVESSGGFTGKIITPATEGYSIRAEFGSNGIYKKYIDNSLSEQRHFSFSQETSIHNHQPVWVVSFNGSALQMAVLFSGNDTLLLNEQAYDGFGHIYARIK